MVHCFIHDVPLEMLLDSVADGQIFYVHEACVFGRSRGRGPLEGHINLGMHPVQPLESEEAENGLQTQFMECVLFKGMFWWLLYLYCPAIH